MNFRLVAAIAGFGLVMGVASVVGIVRSGMEGMLWLVIGVLSAIWIARQVPARRFLHGFLGGLIAGMIAPLIQLLFFDAYLGHNPSAVESFKRLPSGMSPRMLVLVSIPILGILCGLVIGFLAWLAGKMIGRKPATTEAS